MIKTQGEKDIRRFFYYYKMLEKPHVDIIELLKKIEHSSLFSCIRLIDFKTEKVQGKKITIYPNGIIYWHEMNTYENIIDSCLSFIKKEGKNQPIYMQLIPRAIIEQEERMQKALEMNYTIGQYALEISRLEREEKKVQLQYQEWSRDFQKIKKERINDVLDRYLIQKRLYEFFRDEKYKRKMNKWKGIFHIIQQL